MFAKVTNWLVSFLEIQLVITLLSLPVLIYWGLPISYMGPLGNILFTPLLTGFLWTASIYSLCQILHIPSHYLSTILDYITTIWNYLLSCAQPDWLIGFSYTMLWPTIIIALCIIIIYSIIKPSQKIALLIVLSCFMLLFICNKFFSKNQWHQVGKFSLYTLQVNNKNYLIDNGALCSKQNFYAWIDYTLLPELVKSSGITTIDTLVLYKPNKRLAKIAKQLIKQTHVQHILVTTRENCYHQLKKNISQKHIIIDPINKIT